MVEEVPPQPHEPETPEDFEGYYPEDSYTRPYALPPSEFSLKQQ